MPTLKLVKVKLKSPVIELKIHGVIEHFIIDTGAEMSVFSPHIIRDFPDRFKRIQTFGAGGQSETYALPVFFNVLGKTLDTVRINYALNLERFGVSGLIGQDILLQFESVEFRWKEGVVKFNV